ncbi:disease resistance RPP13-like protein 4 [Pyrus communis]|uniref:disease resistance RPP13-like protein 4 n=1 Tax=Pyrus communis TaxID=23211 RepID=UPI0035BF5D88
MDSKKFMPKLLDLLKRAKAGFKDPVVVGDFEYIEKKLHHMEEIDLLPKVKLLDQTLSKQFTDIERQLGKIILGAETTYSKKEEMYKALGLMKRNVDQIIKDSIPLEKKRPTHAPIQESQVHWSTVDQSGLDQKMSQEWSQLGLEDRIYETPAMANIRRTYEDLESMDLKLCFLSFSIFPDGSVMKKRPLIYWWIGEGFFTSTQQKTAEEVGEDIFEKLMRKGLINQTGSNASSCPFVKSCVLNPWIHRMLISLASEARLFHFDSGWQRMPSYDTLTCRRACLVFNNQIRQGDDGPKVDDLLTVFNVNVQYLSLKKEWLNKLKKVGVLQLGRWQDSATHHIEVDDEDFVNQEDVGFLKGLGTQNKHLKYLSLRGISRISQLPSSILNLISLEILDLRACHNLETMPSDISALRKLTHLDMSECYLLERMPKGLDKLSSLQVLKGFLLGSLKNTPCKLGDLAKLKNLKRLSIHMGNESEVQKGELNKLKDISSLCRLKISWGLVSSVFKDQIADEFSFPPNLEKLDLQGIPLENVPKWLNPRQLGNLKKLYIRGGELSSLDHGETGATWKVEILRLKYLTKWDIDWPKLKGSFPRLQHWDLEKFHCHGIKKDVR